METRSRIQLDADEVASTAAALSLPAAPAPEPFEELSVLVRERALLAIRKSLGAWDRSLVLHFAEDEQVAAMFAYKDAIAHAREIGCPEEEIDVACCGVVSLSLLEAAGD